MISDDGKLLDSKVLHGCIELNLYGSVYCAKYGAVVMAKNQPREFGERGVIIFVSSINAEEGSVTNVSYSASKGALNGMLMPMARDLGRYGIRVCAIAPGAFTTPMNTVNPDYNKIKNEIWDSTALGRAAEPEEFAHSVAFCIENTYFNGVHLKLDGGSKLPAPGIIEPALERIRNKKAKL